MASNFVATVQAQTWYPQAEAIFAQAGVPDAVWIATLEAENANLNYNQQTNDPDSAGNPGTSYGLFQLRQPGLGSGYPAQSLLVPLNNVTIAADAMGAAIGGLPSTATVTQKLQAVENAGWPGNLSEDAGREQDLAGVITQLGVSPTQAGVAGLVQNDSGSNPSYQNPPGSIFQQGLSNWWNSTAGPALQNFGTELLWGSIIIAIIGGGFALLAANNSGNAKPVPVPV